LNPNVDNPDQLMPIFIILIININKTMSLAETFSGLDHHLDHRVGWVERSETQHFVFVGFRSSTQPTFHALDETMDQGYFS
jgi:hypothetical protein